MTIHSGLALQSAVYQALINSNALTMKLGGAHIFDDIPNRQSPPYVVFGKSIHSDWSTDHEEGVEHELILHVWSERNGRKEALDLSHEITRLLNVADLSLTDHTLINFRHKFTELERERKTGFFKSEITFRAVTEPVSTS